MPAWRLGRFVGSLLVLAVLAVGGFAGSAGNRSDRSAVTASETSGEGSQLDPGSGAETFGFEWT